MTTDDFPRDALGELEVCPSCGAPRSGAFCSNCGQRFPEGRLTVKGLVLEVPTRFLNVDRGFFHTVLELCRRPGQVARDYVNGRRSPYVNPLTFFLVAATLHLVALTISQGLLIDHVDQQMSQNPQLMENAAERLGPEPGQALGKVYISVLKQGYTYLFLLFMIAPFAVYLRFTTRKLTPRYNLAELGVFSTYTLGHVVLITGLLLPITTRIRIELHVFTSALCYLVMAVHSARHFFDPGPRWRRPRVLAALAAAILTFMLVLTLFFATMMVSQGHVSLTPAT